MASVGGGRPGMPGVKKNKSMNSYANGGPVSAPTPPASGVVRGAGAATKGKSFVPA